MYGMTVPQLLHKFYVEEGMTIPEVANELCVSQSCVNKWLAKYQICKPKSLLAGLSESEINKLKDIT